MNGSKKWYLYFVTTYYWSYFCTWNIFGSYASNKGSGVELAGGKLQESRAGIDARKKHAANLDTELNGIEERITLGQVEI